MTFETYFQQVQTLITKEITPPFDVPFGVPWTDKYSIEFETYYKQELTPTEAVKLHFADIESRSLKDKKRKTLMKK